MMKRKFLSICLVLLLSVPAWAVRGPQGIEYTPHNFSSTGDFLFAAYASGNEDEICVFCHTPHGGQVDSPLWNRDDPTTTYDHYNSDTLSSVIKDQDSRAVNAESLICLSCHDGTIAVGDLINTGGVTPDNNTTFVGDMYLGSGPGPVTGASLASPGANNDLRDDHPISFSYTAVVTATAANNEFNADTDVEPDLLLYGTDQRVECGTCHDPHVNYLTGFGFPGADGDYAPFLRMKNDRSRMCLTCHIK